tara:strand:+ start:5334 stop:6161 length:828 start_codon:yes stop_codon:yes gene_type:complete
MNPLSLSVRIAEGFQSKKHPIIDLEAIASLAREASYDALCMRASQLGVQTSGKDTQEGIRILDTKKLPVTMLTGDFDIVYNNKNGPDCLRNIRPYLELAKKLNTPLLRVAVKKEKDIQWAQKAADEAEKYELKLAHQCHTQSLFETIEGIESTLKKIERPNFGLIYEPANLEICGQDYGAKTIERLSPWIMNVYLQNQILNPDGAVTLNTWCRGPVPFDITEIHEPTGIDFPSIINGLKAVNYSGTITVHQCAPKGTTPSESANTTSRYLRELIK